MRLERSVRVDIPVRRAFDYLADFTTTTEWDPGTLSTVRCAGDGGVGTTYRNTSRFLGRETALIYVVEELVTDERIRLRGENTTVIAMDTMTFRQSGSGTEVTYTATGDLELHGVTKQVDVAITARRNGDNIEVTGTIPVVFADYQIDNPSSNGITTQDNGVVEFLLVFSQN